MKKDNIHEIISLLREEYRSWKTPAVTIIAECDHNPFKVLISCIISLRTKDEVTALASARLFVCADNPEKMQIVPIEEISRLIYPAGFYRTKAQQIQAISQRLVAEYAQEGH